MLNSVESEKRKRQKKVKEAKKLIFVCESNISTQQFADCFY